MSTITRPYVASLLVFLAAVAVAAERQAPAGQPEQSFKGVVRKNKVPISTEIIRFTLPKAAEADLPNGLRLIVLEDHRLPEVSFELVIPGAGGYFDPEGRPGLAGIAASLMREGTATRTSSQISRDLEVMDASLGVTAGLSSTEASMRGSALSDQFDRLMDLAADVLRRPAFPEEEIGRYKVRQRAALVQQRSNPGFLAQEMFTRAVYGAHPGSRVSPTLELLESVTRNELAGFHRAKYVPDHAVLAVAGDVSMSQVRALAEAKLGEWGKSGQARPTVEHPAPPAGPAVLFVARPGSVQTNLVVGVQAIDRLSPDYDALQVMNKVIGGGPTGRLFIHLREEKGYTYGAGSTVVAREYRGAWLASTSVRTEVTEPALNDLIAEIAALRDQPVPDQELADAKRSLVAAFALSLESPSELLSLHVARWRYGLPVDYWDRYAERVMAIDVERVRATARRYLTPDRLQIVAVGDPGRVAAALKKHGEVRAFDADGKPIVLSGS